MPLRLAPLRTVLCAAVLGALVVAASPANADSRARAVRVPAWVDPTPLDPRAAAVRVAADDGVIWLLSDHQVRTDPTIERYTRLAFRVEATTGVEAISELHLDYDPSFEKLALHFVHILRGGRVIDALRTADWKVIQPEADLDKRIYSGDLEGLLFLHDVRVGDVIDYAYSIRGNPPTLGGHFVQQIILDEDAGVADLRRRLVADVARPLRLQPHGEGAAPAETVDGGLRQYTWRRANVVAPQGEDDVPSWYRSGPWVDVSDFAGWSDVAAAAADLFETAAAPPPELAAQVAEWRSLPTEEARALAATRFVQDEIRYLGVEIGPHSHQPFAPSTVLKRRFGDCKDKSLLLVTLLRSLGVTAAPVLVSTTWRQALDERLPSPFAFDHAIVRATLGGRPVFLDATAALERGPLVGREPPPYERALVVARDTTALVPIGDPRPKTATYDVDETYTLPPPPGGSTARLDVVTTYRGDDADDMRAKLANTSAAELGRRYLNYYAETFPDVRALGDPSFEDDAAANVIVAREQYDLPGFWKDGARDLAPWAMDSYLETPRFSRRQKPLAVSFPEHDAQHIHVKGGDWQPEVPEPMDARDETVHFHSASHLKDGVLTLDYEYEALTDSVPAAKVPAHLALLERVRKDWSYTVQASSGESSTAPEKATPARRATQQTWRIRWVLLGAIAVSAVVGMARGLVLWLRRRSFRRRATLEQGEAPTRPIVVSNEAEIDAQVRKARCACKARLARAPSTPPVSELKLGDRTVQAVPVACEGCGQGRRLYFELRAG
jgi:transglutaminase-like putative cysteine protease